MTKNHEPADNPLQEQPFVSHLLELRDRLLRAVVVVAVVFLCLFPFANDIYIWVASPLMAHLPVGTSMIATEVASPFLTPFKLSLVAAVFLSMPFILYQIWAFIAPGLYRHEKRMVMPLVVSSTLLFYIGMLFAYYVVFPLVFAFLTSTAPEGITVATDISKYLDFILTLFFAFGMAFEVPIATIILVWMGITSPEKLAEKRPYIIVGAFLLGMLLTPPDVISQTLLALPMWILFELGLIFSRMFVRQPDRDENGEQEPADGSITSANPSTETAGDPPVYPAGGSVVPVDSDLGAGATPPDDRPRFDGDPGMDVVDPERFVPLSDEELEAELNLIEAQEDQQEEVAAGPTDLIEQKLLQIQALRDEGDELGARQLLYEVLADGSGSQIEVARNILQQLDQG